MKSSWTDCGNGGMKWNDDGIQWGMGQKQKREWGKCGKMAAAGNGRNN